MGKKTTKSILEAEAKKYIKDFRPRVKDVLEKATLSLLGLQKGYGGEYTIDHCNGRNSVLNDAFRDIAMEEAKKIASSYKPTKEDFVNFKKAFEMEYKKQMDYAIRDLARTKAQEEAKKELDKIKLNFDEILQNIFNDTEDRSIW